MVVAVAVGGAFVVEIVVIVVVVVKVIANDVLLSIVIFIIIIIVIFVVFVILFVVLSVWRVPTKQPVEGDGMQVVSDVVVHNGYSGEVGR